MAIHAGVIVAAFVIVAGVFVIVVVDIVTGLSVGEITPVEVAESVA